MNAKSFDAPRANLDLDWLTAEVSELRAAYAAANTVALSDTDAWETVAAGGHDIRVLAHRPARAIREDCAIFYFHGGGWIVGSPATHMEVSKTISDLTGLRVLSVDYRLAPEHTAPAPVEDGLGVLHAYLAKPLTQGGIRTAFLCGDSAGGAIALAVERLADEATRTSILGICGLYGGFGELDAPSVDRYGKRSDGMDRACLERYWRLANQGATPSPYAIVSLKGPGAVPVYLLAAEMDAVADDSIRLAEAMRAAGRKVTLQVVPSQPHSFLQAVPPAQRAAFLTDIVRWIKGLVK